MTIIGVFYFGKSQPCYFCDHRKAQKELKDQIACLEEQLRAIEDEQSCPVDLESYINKLNSAKKRIIVVNNILQGAQVTKYFNFKSYLKTPLH